MAENTIKLAVYGIPPVELEIEAAGADIMPGMLLKRDNAGTIIRHDIADGPASPKLIAVENLFEGKTIDDLYVSGENVYIIAARPGDLMWMWLDATVTVSIGDYVSSNGDGALKLAPAPPTTPGSLVGTTIEALTLGALQRVKVEIA